MRSLPIRFSNQNLYAFLVSPMCATYAAHLILLGAIFLLFSGVIFDGEELHYLERGTTDEGGGREDDEGEENGITAVHFLYRHSDVQTNQTCGKEVVFECFILILRVVVICQAATDPVIFVWSFCQFTIVF
jgi:hypothetical protein